MFFPRSAKRRIHLRENFFAQEYVSVFLDRRGGKRRSGKFRRRKSEWTATRGRKSLAVPRKQNLEYEIRKVNFFGENVMPAVSKFNSKRGITRCRGSGDGILLQESPFVRLESVTYTYLEIWEGRNKKVSSSNPLNCPSNFDIYDIFRANKRIWKLWKPRRIRRVWIGSTLISFEDWL